MSRENGECLKNLMTPFKAISGRSRFHGFRRVIHYAAVAALCLLSMYAVPTIAQDTIGDTPTSVSPPRLPTDVAVGAYLIGLSQVSEPSDPFPTVDVEVFLNLTWHDPRLVSEDDERTPQVFQEEEAEEKLSEIWSPDVEVQNEVEQRQTESIELTIFADGRVDYEERFGATLNAELNLSRFPFDRQALDMELQSFVWDRGEISLVLNDPQTGFDEEFETPEWRVTAVEGLIGTGMEVRDDREFSTYTFRIHAERHSGHYLLRLFLPLLFVMAATWLAFWEPAQERYRIGFFALLTVVATHAVVARSLPRLSYPTLADMVLIFCYVTAISVIAVGVVVRRNEATGNIKRARAIDRYSLWLLPVTAAIVLSVTAVILWI